MRKNTEASEHGRGEHNSTHTFRNTIGPILILTSIFFLNFTSRISTAPLAPRIEADLILSHAQTGTLFLFISIGYFLTLVGSGFISSRLNHKHTIVTSNTVLGIALIGTAFCTGSWTMRLGLFSVGMAAGLYLPSAIATLTSLVPSQHWGKAIAIHELAPNLSFIAAPLISEAVLVRFSWREVFLILGVMALIMSPIFMRHSRGGDFKGEAPGFGALGQLFGNLSFWLMVLMFSLGVIGTLGLYTMLPLYLVSEHGIDRNVANTLIAFSRIPSVLMAFIAGWATDRIGPQRTLKIVLLVAGVMTFFLGIASSSIIRYLVFLQPLVAVCFFPAGFAAMSSIVPPGFRNIAVSLIVPLAFVAGGGLAPIFIGFLGDKGNFALGIMICGGLIAIGSLFTGLLRFHGQSE
ncbi:MAG: MFS transporter [Deltaproteobacteria bacterium]|jgi:NNP family nitrate/nitrite transporter-like MFS transporter|nr:MFS transporter [Deltaproteobacteria bacterium]